MLQGSLDNFALDEVLGLLSSTAKTGRLSLKGDRGEGSLVLQEGHLVEAKASQTANGTAPEDVVFELLRYVSGEFSFDACQVAPADSAQAVGDVLASAENRLADWRTIEAVVPSLGHRVSAAPSLPADEITLNRSEWSTLRAIGNGCPVSSVCDELGLGEVDGSRHIKAMADRGLVNVSTPDSGVTDPATVHGARTTAAIAASAAANPAAAAPRPRVEPPAQSAATTTARLGGTRPPEPATGSPAPADTPVARAPIMVASPGPAPIESTLTGSALARPPARHEAQPAHDEASLARDAALKARDAALKARDAAPLAPMTIATLDDLRMTDEAGSAPSSSAPAAQAPAAQPAPALLSTAPPPRSRPPMPSAPTVDELQGLSAVSDFDAAPVPPAVPEAKSATVAGQGTESTPEPDSKPGGLLMRYLKSDG